MTRRTPIPLFTLGTALTFGALALITMNGVAIPQASGLQPSGPLGTPSPVGTPAPVNPGLGDDPDPSPPPPNCKQTQNAGLCGMNQSIGSITCGTQTCPLKVISHGSILNCQGSQTGGLESCSTLQCTKTTLTYTCGTPQGGGQECIESASVENVVPISFSSGQTCPPAETQP